MSASIVRSSFDAPALLKVVAMVAIAVGVGVWGAFLPAPAPAKLPPALDAGAVPAQATAPVAQWFGGAALRVRVAVVGTIASESGAGAALLSVDGAPPRAYRVGTELAPGVILQAVAPTAVSIDQDGTIEQISMPVSPHARVRGFVPVSEAPARKP